MEVLAALPAQRGEEATMFRFSRFGVATVAVLPALVIGAAAVAAQDAKAIPVNIGWQPGGIFAFYVARELKLFEQAGVAPNYVKFTAGPPMFAAFQSASIDVSWGEIGRAHV